MKVRKSSESMHVAAQYLRAKKEKVCPRIDFVDDV